MLSCRSKLNVGSNNILSSMRVDKSFLLSLERVLREIIEPLMMVEIVGPHLVLKTSVFEHNQVLIESLEKTLRWILPGEKSFSLGVVIPQLEDSLGVVQRLVFKVVCKMDVIYTCLSWSILIKWIYLKY